MSSNDDFQFPRHGIVPPGDVENSDRMADLAQLVFDDVMYNILHDIVLKVHREEKIARAATAAILVEAKAAEDDPNTADEPDLIDHQAETDAAIYKNGDVFLKGNPFKTTTEIHCPKCGKPRLLHPTDGNRARKPDPNIDYCKKHPYIEKPYHDVYGQVYQPDGPGRGKKKKDMINPLFGNTGSATNGSQDSPPSEVPVPKLLNFPTGKCVGCGNAIMIKRLNGHMAKCMGGGGRESSRNANLKMQNGGNGTPPGSRNTTPAPSNASSNKRDRDDEDSDSSPHKKSKKNGKDGVLKKTAVSKKLKDLKAPKMVKTASQQRESNLSFEEKAPGLSDSEDDGGDYKDGEYGSTISVDPKKKSKPSVAVSNGKKIVKDRKKWLHGNRGVKSLDPPESSPSKPVTKVKAEAVNGKAEVVGDSESSQTLSSPN